MCFNSEFNNQPWYDQESMFLGVTQEELEMIDEQIKKNIFTANNK